MALDRQELELRYRGFSSTYRIGTQILLVVAGLGVVAAVFWFIFHSSAAFMNTSEEATSTAR